VTSRLPRSAAGSNRARAARTARPLGLAWAGPPGGVAPSPRAAAQGSPRPSTPGSGTARPASQRPGSRASTADGQTRTAIMPQLAHPRQIAGHRPRTSSESVPAEPGVTVTEIARRLGKSQQAMSLAADRLERLGFIERRVGAGRAVGLHATDAGRTTSADGVHRELAAEDRTRAVPGSDGSTRSSGSSRVSATPCSRRRPPAEKRLRQPATGVGPQRARAAVCSAERAAGSTLARDEGVGGDARDRQRRMRRFGTSQTF
jgi:DNA-binding transcriptional ArsR family regulator